MNERINFLAKRALTGDIYPKPVFYEPENPKTPVDTGNAIYKFLSLQPVLFDKNEYLVDRYRFFGNDDDYVDDIAKAVVDTMYDIKNQMRSPYMNTLVIGSFVGATHPNLILGKRTKATPDGRFFWRCLYHGCQPKSWQGQRRNYSVVKFHCKA